MDTTRCGTVGFTTHGRRRTLLDELEQLAERAPAALLRGERGVLSALRNSAAQLLRVGGGELLHEGADARVVGDQLGAPALGLVQRERIPWRGRAACRAPPGGSARCPRRASACRCAASGAACPVRARAPVFVHRIAQAFGDVQRPARDSGSATKRFAEILQFVRGLLALRSCWGARRRSRRRRSVGAGRGGHRRTGAEAANGWV